MADTQNLTGTIAAFFDNSDDARQAVEALRDAGFTSAHIGVAHRGKYGSSSAAPAASTTTTTTARNQTKEHGSSTWDKVKNWFSGDEPEPYENERPRGDLAGREVIDPDAGSGYASSDLHGSFRYLDIPEDQSRYFSHRLERSTDGAVVTVNAGARRAEAEQILTQYGGDLATNASTYDYGETGYRSGTGYSQAAGTETASTTAREDYRDQNPENIQLLGEVLRVHKDRVSRGEVRIRKEVITDNQTVQVPVTREELVIERRPGDDTAAPEGTIGESEIRVPLNEERATLDKSTVVREEVSVGKRPVEEVRDVTGEVRREELVVDDSTRKEDPNRRVA
ncbi:MAG TPA: YsnF/AvaK domain-containing protein [Terracidiphilus sp.]